MTLFFLRLFGLILVRLPLPAVKALTALSGAVFFLVARQRRRSLLANLTHAFPERDYRWVVATGKESIRQMVEFGLLAGALPHLSEKRLREIFFMTSPSEKLLREKAATERPVVILAPHLGPQEGLCLLPYLFPDGPPIGAIYRPTNNKTVDTWVRESRERFGLKLFSRKRGLQNAIRLLKSNEWLGLLFDQNSTKHGALITFFDRVASATELPGILVARHDADCIFLYAARRRFWRIELCVEQGPVTKDKDEINFEINRWLENLLRDHEELLPSWLWPHNRWRHRRVPKLSLREKRNLLEKQNAFLARTHVPRKEPFYIRLPDRMSEVSIVLPLLRAIRRSRPDAEITVIGRAENLSLVQEARLCEHAIPLPSGAGYFSTCWSLRRRFPSAHIVFADSFWADFEAWLIGAPHRFGVQSSARRRFLLNHRWTPRDDIDPTSQPLRSWEEFLRAQQLEGPLVPSAPTEEAER